MAISGIFCGIFRQTAANPTDEIMGAPNFNFSPKFYQHGRFSAQNCVILKKQLPTRKNFRRQAQKLRGGGQLPPLSVFLAMTPLIFTMTRRNRGRQNRDQLTGHCRQHALATELMHPERAKMHHF